MTTREQLSLALWDEFPSPPTFKEGTTMCQETDVATTICIVRAVLSKLSVVERTTVMRAVGSGLIVEAHARHAFADGLTFAPPISKELIRLINTSIQDTLTELHQSKVRATSPERISGKKGSSSAFL